jgi:UDP-GlcNAc:undecaprenyl-phosphate GlcNAc-1-phosphate transferase
MNIYILAFVIAAVIACTVTPLLRWQTRAGRLTPDPGAEGSPAPRVGGVAIFIAFAATPLIASLLSDRVHEIIVDEWPEIAGLLVCAATVFFIGLLDDLVEQPWYIKLAVQIAAAIGAYAAGFRVGEMTLPFGGSVELGVMDLVVTVLWLVFVTNAINLIDGRDGVAAGIVAIGAAVMAFVASDLQHALIALLFATLSGAALGFVPFNFPPASRFLGDSGAYLLGFLLGALSISGFLDNTGRVPLYIPLVMLGLPVLDTFLSWLRRYLDGRNPFHPDEDHMHHRLERMYQLGPRGLVLAMYALAAAFGAAALLLHLLYKSVGTPVVSGIVLVFAVVIMLALGYLETMWNSTRVVRVRQAVNRRPPPPPPPPASSGRPPQAVPARRQPG